MLLSEIWGVVSGGERTWFLGMRLAFSTGWYNVVSRAHMTEASLLTESHHDLGTSKIGLAQDFGSLIRRDS
jgi:hypothetical protein